MESSSIALLDNGMQINTVTAQLHGKVLTGGGTNYQPDWQKSHLHRSRKCLHLTSRLCHCQGSSGCSPGLQ